MEHFPSFIVKKPCIPESDLAGTIVSIGSQVKGWKVGDHVFGITPGKDIFKTGQGGLAEYTVVQTQNMYFQLKLN
jgi:NADPH:quinone reductase-like Zn-dependent oxidoreductase